MQYPVAGGLRLLCRRCAEGASLKPLLAAACVSCGDSPLEVTVSGACIRQSRFPAVGEGALRGSAGEEAQGRSAGGAEPLGSEPPKDHGTLKACRVQECPKLRSRPRVTSNAMGWQGAMTASRTRSCPAMASTPAHFQRAACRGACLTQGLNAHGVSTLGFRPATPSEWLLVVTRMVGVRRTS